MEANGIPRAPLEARRSLRVGLVRDIFDTVTRSKECFLNNFQLPASHIEPLFNTRHLVLWALLSADLVVSAGIGTLAWKGLTTRGINVAGRHLVSPNGAEGVAIGDLDPEGIVRVNGENWSAVAVNGAVRAGTPVQVVRVAGVRLEVWGDETAAACGGSELDVAIPTEGAPSSPAEATNEGGGS